MRIIYTICSNRFYKAYPNIDYDECILPSQEVIMCNYQQLSRIGVKMIRCTLINELFSWSDEELTALKTLKDIATRDTLEHKNIDTSITYLSLCMHWLLILDAKFLVILDVNDNIIIWALVWINDVIEQ